MQHWLRILLCSTRAGVVLTDRNKDFPLRSLDVPATSDTAEAHRDCMLAIARNNDRKAFAALFAYFAPRVKSYLMRGGTPADVAEELTQEAMAMVWRRASSFDPRQASVATWIFTIAGNKRIDRFRRENRPEPDPDDPALVPDADPAADDVIEADQTARAIRKVLDELPEEQAEVIRLAFFEDLAHSEIAEKTGLPLGTVKSRLRLAMDKIRRSLGHMVE